VFFQHDEVLLHTPAEAAEETADAVRTAAAAAGRRVFGDTPVRFPMHPRIVEGYDESAVSGRPGQAGDADSVARRTS
jgi:DNA polymerase-1